MAIIFPIRARRGDPNGHMIVQQNLEYLAEQVDKVTGGLAAGSATITNPATNVLVNHSLGVASYFVTVTPRADPVGRYWISNKTAASFQLNLSAAPAGSLAFDWIAKGA